MNLRDSLNQYYYDEIVCDLRRLAKNGGGELSFNSIMYLDVISYQEQSGGCTVSRLAKTLHISNSAATMKVNELMHLGLVEKVRSETDRRVVYLHLSPLAAAGVCESDAPYERAVQKIETQYSEEEITLFCQMLQVFADEYQKENSI